MRLGDGGLVAAVSHPPPHDVAADPVRVPAVVLAALPDALRRHQRVFDTTGGAHAAALFDLGPVGGTVPEPLVVREDVGGHNALDKVVGCALRHHGLTG